MKLRLLLCFLGGLLPSLSWAAGMPVLKFGSADCQLLVDGQIAKEQSVKLITLTIEDHLGRFIEIQFGDENQKIQYQLLIEDDIESVESNGVVVLQNLLVGEVESSSEFIATEPRWLRIAQGPYSVACAIKP